MADRGSPLQVLAEALPSAVFFLAMGLNVPLRNSALAAMAVALAVLLLMAARRWRPQPILLGVNLHFAALPPLIWGLWVFGARELALTFYSLAVPLVPVVILATSAALLFWTRDLPLIRGAGRRLLLVALFSAQAAAVLWTILIPGSPLIRVALPVVLLILISERLNARLSAAPDGDRDA